MLSSTTEIRARVSLRGVRHIDCTSIELYSHPQEGTNVGNLGCGSSNGGVRRTGSSGDDLLGVLLVGVDGPRGEGVARKSDWGSASSGVGTSSDGTVLDGAGGGESACDGRSHQG